MHKAGARKAEAPSHGGKSGESGREWERGVKPKKRVEKLKEAEERVGEEETTQRPAEKSSSVRRAISALLLLRNLLSFSLSLSPPPQ